MMLVSMAYAYGPEDNDGRGHHHRTTDERNQHGFDGAGHSRQNGGRLLGQDGHGQRGYQGGQAHGNGGYKNTQSQTHGHNDGDSKLF